MTIFSLFSWEKRFYEDKDFEIITNKVFVVENSAWYQIKENYPNYLHYQFHLKVHSLDWDSQLSHKKGKTMFLWNMSKNWRLTFFPLMRFSTVQKLLKFFFSVLLLRQSGWCWCLVIHIQFGFNQWNQHGKS